MTSNQDQCMHQIAPWPRELEQLLSRLRYKESWKFRLFRDYVRDDADTHGGESRGLTLSILITTPDSYDPKTLIRVQHLFPVPPATYNLQSWQRWLLEKIILVERHEACEFFTIHTPREGDGGTYYKPFAPLHGPGEDPYRVVELATDQQRRTSFRGEVNE